MSRVNKTKNNLQSIWNDLDKAYELIERSLVSINRMNILSEKIKEAADSFDISEISSLKEQVEIEMDQLKEEL